MDTQDLLSIENRIKKLEKQNRQFKLGFLAILAALIGVSMVGFMEEDVAARGPDELATRKLLVLDENHATRVSISVDENGPRLAMYDETGEPRATISVTGDGPSLDLYDETGEPRATISVTGDGPSLDLYDETGKPRASIGAYEYGSGLLLYDKNGKNGATIAVEEGPILVLFNKDGKVLTQLP